MSKEYLPLDKQKRTSPRINTKLHAFYRLKNQESWVDCTIFNVSKGGLYIEGKFSFYVNDLLELKFSLGSHLIKAESKIKSISGKKAGAGFVKISDADKIYLENFIQEKIYSD